MKIINVIRRLFCSHEFEDLNKTVVGATMDWGGRATRVFEFKRKCKLCGKESTDNFILYGDRDLHPEFYDVDGWPIDKDGNKLDIC